VNLRLRQVLVNTLLVCILQLAIACRQIFRVAESAFDDTHYAALRGDSAARRQRGGADGRDAWLTHCVFCQAGQNSTRCHVKTRAQFENACRIQYHPVTTRHLWATGGNAHRHGCVEQSMMRSAKRAGIQYGHQQHQGA